MSQNHIAADERLIGRNAGTFLSGSSTPASPLSRCSYSSPTTGQTAPARVVDTPAGPASLWFGKA